MKRISVAWSRSRDARIAYVFIAPFFVLFLIFGLGPAIASFAMSLLDYRFSSGAGFLGLGNSTFIGLDNFRRLGEDPMFWTSLRVTIVYALISVPLTVVVSLALALLVGQPLKGIGVFRTLLFLPYVTSLVMASMIWGWIYDYNGLLNALLKTVGIPPMDWLQSVTSVLPSIAVMTTWQGFGFSMMIFLSGLLAIPKEYYEAAQLDGANGIQRFRHVTLPLLRPVVFFVAVIGTIGAFQVFDPFYVMTGGGPVRASYSVVFMLYDQGFRYFDFGYGGAIGVALFVLILAFSLVQRFVLSRGGK